MPKIKNNMCMGDEQPPREMNQPAGPSHSPTTSGPSPATANSTISHHVSAIQRLDKEYANLTSSEEEIEKCLETLRREESTLRLALDQSSSSLKEQRDREAKRRALEAEERLEKALLMGEDESDDSSCDKSEMV